MDCRGEGQVVFAMMAKTVLPNPRQAVEGDEGQTCYANDGRNTGAPSPSSNRDGNGRDDVAFTGPSKSAVSPREHTAAQREANLKIRNASAVVAMTAFDRIKTSSGNRWGDVRAHELAGMRRDGTMAKALADYLGPLEGNRRFRLIRELMTAPQFEVILERVRGQNDAT